MNNKTKRVISRAMAYIVAITGCICVIIPLSWMVITSLKSMADITLSKGIELFPSGPTLKNFINIWKEYPIATYISNSFVTVGGSTVFGILCIVFYCIAYETTFRPIFKNKIRLFASCSGR